MKRDGFTIIEVMIFLAISGLMLAMAMVGSGNLARQARFSDTINSFHSLMQRQYEEVVNGVNTRQAGTPGCGGPTSTRPGADSCLLLGKVISFEENGGKTVTIRYVTGNQVTSPTDTMTDLFWTNPQLKANGAQTIELGWGASFQVASRYKPRAPANVALDPVKSGVASRAIINNVAFLRAPNSSQIVTYFFYSSTDSQASVQSALSTSGLAGATWNHPYTTGTKAAICIVNIDDWSASSTPAAAIIFGTGQGAAAIDTDFEPDRNSQPLSECNS